MSFTIARSLDEAIEAMSTGARPIAGEHPARSVGAVSGRREPDDQASRMRVAEPGHRSSPVRFIGERAPFLDGHPLAPGDQPRAPPALAHVVPQTVDRIGG